MRGRRPGQKGMCRGGGGGEGVHEVLVGLLRVAVAATTTASTRHLLLSLPAIATYCYRYLLSLPVAYAGLCCTLCTCRHRAYRCH